MRGLNDVVLHMHAAKLTRNQIVMFTFADMMTIAEVAGALAAKAARLAGEGSRDAAAHLAMSRVFARKAARQVQDGAARCAGGLLGRYGRRKHWPRARPCWPASTTDCPCP